MFAVLAAVAALSQGAPVQPVSPSARIAVTTPNPERTALAARLFKAMGAQDSLAASADAIAGVLFDQLSDRRDFDPAWRAPAETAAREAVAAVEPQIMERWIALWARDLDEAELKAAIAFYESPVAHKINASSVAREAELKSILTDLAPVIDREAASRFCQKTTACLRPDAI